MVPILTGSNLVNNFLAGGPELEPPPWSSAGRLDDILRTWNNTMSIIKICLDSHFHKWYFQLHSMVSFHKQWWKERNSMTYDPPEILCIDLFANYYIFSTLIMISLLNRTTLHLHLISNEIHLGLIPTLMPTLDKTMLNLKCDWT